MSLCVRESHCGCFVVCAAKFILIPLMTEQRLGNYGEGEATTWVHFHT